MKRSRYNNRGFSGKTVIDKVTDAQEITNTFVVDTTKENLDFKKTAIFEKDVEISGKLNVNLSNNNTVPNGNFFGLYNMTSLHITDELKVGTNFIRDNSGNIDISGNLVLEESLVFDPLINNPNEQNVEFDIISGSLEDITNNRRNFTLNWFLPDKLQVFISTNHQTPLLKYDRNNDGKFSISNKIIEISGSSISIAPAQTGDAFKINRNTDITGNLEVNNTTTLNDTLAVTNLVTFQDNLHLTGNLNIGNNSNNKNSSIKLDTSGSLIFKQSEDISGILTFGNYVNNSGDPSFVINNSILPKITNNIDIGSEEYNFNTIYANSLKQNNNNEPITIFETNQDNLLVLHNLDETTIERTLDVSGLTTLQKTDISGHLDASGVTISDKLDVSSDTLLRSKVDISGGLFTNTANIASTLNVLGNTTLQKTDIISHLDASGVTISDKLYVSANTLLRSQVDISGGLFTNTGNIAGTLNVLGTTTLQKTDISGHLDVSGVTISDIINVPNPILDINATNKKYVDERIEKHVQANTGTGQILNTIEINGIRYTIPGTGSGGSGGSSNLIEIKELISTDILLDCGEDYKDYKYFEIIIVNIVGKKKGYVGWKAFSTITTEIDTNVNNKWKTSVITNNTNEVITSISKNFHILGYHSNGKQNIKSQIFNLNNNDIKYSTFNNIGIHNNTSNTISQIGSTSQDDKTSCRYIQLNLYDLDGTKINMDSGTVLLYGFSTTISSNNINRIDNDLRIGNDTSDLLLIESSIIIPNPIAENHATTKKYVDELNGIKLISTTNISKQQDNLLLDTTSEYKTFDYFKLVIKGISVTHKGYIGVQFSEYNNYDDAITSDVFNKWKLNKLNDNNTDVFTNKIKKWHILGFSTTGEQDLELTIFNMNNNNNNKFIKFSNIGLHSGTGIPFIQDGSTFQQNSTSFRYIFINNFIDSDTTSPSGQINNNCKIFLYGYK